MRRNVSTSRSIPQGLANFVCEFAAGIRLTTTIEVYVARSWESPPTSAIQTCHPARIVVAKGSSRQEPRRHRW
jgi:hypothetical protein